jgi:hypothetical protein
VRAQVAAAPVPFTIPPPPPLLRAEVPAVQVRSEPPIAAARDAAPGDAAREQQPELVAKTHVVVLVPQTSKPMIVPEVERAPVSETAQPARVIWIPLADRVPDATAEALSMIAAAASGLRIEPRSQAEKPRAPISERLVMIDRELHWLERHRGGLTAAAALAGATATATAATTASFAASAEIAAPPTALTEAPAAPGKPQTLPPPKVVAPRVGSASAVAIKPITAEAPANLTLSDEFTAVPAAGSFLEADVTIVRREPAADAPPVSPSLASARALERMRRMRAEAAIDAATDASYRGNVEEASVAIVPPGSVPAGGPDIAAPRLASDSANERPADKLRRFIKALEGR